MSEEINRLFYDCNKIKSIDMSGLYLGNITGLF